MSRWQQQARPRFLLVVVLFALLAGCTSDAPRTQSQSGEGASPAPRDATSLSPSGQDRLDSFLEKTRPVAEGSYGGGQYLASIRYTSSTDSAALFYRRRSTVIATTDDNWANAAGLVIGEDLADLLDYLPLGRGAVAIKAKDQSPRRSYPPFVLFADGTIETLAVSDAPREVDADDEVLLDLYFGPEIGLGDRLLGADLAVPEIFPLPQLPSNAAGAGRTFQHVPGREGLVKVAGYIGGIDGGVWRFSESVDNGRTWQTTMLPLPLAGHSTRPGCGGSRSCDIHGYTDAPRPAVGPGNSQAFALLDAPQDYPYVLRQLWITNDEQTFDLAALPRDRMAFTGMEFASDGGLLVAEASGQYNQCDACRPGQIWHWSAGRTKPAPLPNAPTVFSRHPGINFYYAGGGVTVAHTSKRGIAITTDGYHWTEVMPGG